MPPCSEDHPPDSVCKCAEHCLLTCVRLDTAYAVVCFIIYFLLGFFGAARWGLDTNTNLLVNDWGPPAYQGALNILLGIYLALTNPPLVYPVAHILRVRLLPFLSIHRRGQRSDSVGCCAKPWHWRSLRCSVDDSMLCPVFVRCLLPSGLAARQRLWILPALHHHLPYPGGLPGNCAGSTVQFFSGVLYFCLNSWTCDILLGEMIGRSSHPHMVEATFTSICMIC